MRWGQSIFCLGNLKETWVIGIKLHGIYHTLFPIFMDQKQVPGIKETDSLHVTLGNAFLNTGHSQAFGRILSDSP